jgi:hypothetical protein
MNAKDVMRQVAETGHMLAQAYTADLAEADLVVRSVPGSNHIAWQLGHIIGGTAKMLGELGHKGPELPGGFAEAHGKDAAGSDDRSRFLKKAEYLAFLEQSKAAIFAAIDATPEADFDKPGPEAMREYAPTVGAALLILGQHWMMHVGQFVPIRRKLGKPAMF